MIIISKTYQNLLLLLFFASSTVNAALIAEKTPADVYVQVQLLSEDVRALRKNNKIHTPWPEVTIETGHAPRHVFQKTLEILDKINRYRVYVANTGGITVPRFPGRDITPNEVYSVVVRLRNELKLLVNLEETETKNSTRKGPAAKLITPAKVYAALSEISISLDETLGIRGITPSDVYIRSEQVLQLALFLRKSQNLPMVIEKPKLTEGKLPNHALQHVNQLLKQINLSEKNLWMKPIEVPDVPRRVISPGDVYDAMGLALAELQRIQYRLGLERSFKISPVEGTKTLDDVIQNVDYSTLLMPNFEIQNKLQQYDQESLIKTPNHVYSITTHILEELQKYRRLRGIKTSPGQVKLISGMKPHHVYAKTLEVIEKINLLRQQQNIGAITESEYPLRKITPTEVFNEALRVDEELNILYQNSGMHNELWITASDVPVFNDKTPSDVFFNMQKISLLLDTLLSGDAFTPNYVYREAHRIQQEILILARHFGEKVSDGVWNNIRLQQQTLPENVLPQVKKMLRLILDVQQRAGMSQVREYSVVHSEIITPAEVYNLIRVAASELVELKVFLGLNKLPPFEPKVVGKTSGDVLQLIQGNQAILNHILHKKSSSDSELQQ